MGFLQSLLGIYGGPDDAGGNARHSPQAMTFTDPRLLEMIRSGSGGVDALRNSAVNRCVSLISRGIGMLPLGMQALDADGNPAGTARDHPLHRLLTRQPRKGQTPFTFKSLMQQTVLMKGNAYAYPVRVNGRVSELLFLPSANVRTVQKDDFSVEHVVKGKNGERVFQGGELLHLMGPSEDGITGKSIIDYARDVVEMSRTSDKAMKSSMQQGATPGGALEFPETRTLTDEAFDRLRNQLDNDFSGDNAGRWMILEQGLKANVFQYNSRNAQGIELRNQLVEEVARMFGVPRPFLMLDDTSWGTGIEQLGIFFVQYTLAPWFSAWEEAIAIALMGDAERDRFRPKFNEKALLRGSMKDQAEFLAKLTGAGGTPQIMQQNEARAALELPPLAEGWGLSNPMKGNPNAQP